MPRERPARAGSKPKEIPEWYITLAKLPFKWWHAVAVVVVPMLAFIVHQASNNPVTMISVTNKEQLKEVFFGKDAWCVLCHNESTPLPGVFEATATRLKDEMKFGVLDCSAKLPDSGVTIFKRWKLDLSLGAPIIFVTGGGPKPKQIPSSATRVEYEFVKQLRKATKRSASPIESTHELQQMCLNKPTCALVMQGYGEMTASATKTVESMMKSNRDMTVAMIDSSRFMLTMEKGHAPRFVLGQNRLVVFKNTSAGAAMPATSDEPSAATTLFASAHSNDFVGHLVHAFVDYVGSGDALFEPVTTDAALVQVVERPPPPPRRVERKEPEPEAVGKAPLTEEERRAKEAQRREDMEREAAQNAFVQDADDGDEEAVTSDDDGEEEVVDLDDE